MGSEKKTFMRRPNAPTLAQSVITRRFPVAPSRRDALFFVSIYCGLPLVPDVYHEKSWQLFRDSHESDYFSRVGSGRAGA